MRRIVVLSGEFAGLWSAVGAARKLDELRITPDQVEVVLIDRTDWHAIRVRNYEADLADVRVRFDEILPPIGVRRVRGEVKDIDLDQRRIGVDSLSEPIGYDRLVFALGSQLARPVLPGLMEQAFDVDTCEGAVRLEEHLAALRSRPASRGRRTVLVVGAGLTGIEVATEMPARLAPIGGGRVILADHAPWIGSNMGEEAREVIDRALAALNVETRPGFAVASVDADGARLESGERIDAGTIVWCAGMRSHPLTSRFPVPLDGFGRLPVDQCLKVKGLNAEFAAGDCAWLEIDDRRCGIEAVRDRPGSVLAGIKLTSRTS